MPRSRPLPLSEEWTDPDAYVDALLSFATSSDLFRHLCGGVHMMDFLTREPDLYSSLLPENWRTFFDQHGIQVILDLLLREDISSLLEQSREHDSEKKWRGSPFPPTDLLEYIHTIQRLSLGRKFTPPQSEQPKIPYHVSVGMNRKKYHEVAHFSKYVNSLCTTVAEQRGDPISHIVDFGSGQNYLGRTLTSPPYNKHIIAIERKHQYINGARGMDVHAKLVKKEKKVVFFNKKESSCQDCEDLEAQATAKPTLPEVGVVKTVPTDVSTMPAGVDGDDVAVFSVFRDIDLNPNELGISPYKNGPPPKKAVIIDEEEDWVEPEGAMDYIEHDIKDGYLEPIIKDVIESRPDEIDSDEARMDPRVMVISLHSCGNLVHHGVRSLVLNPSVKTIAMIGCCYNLMTERLGPATYKLPILRTQHPRLIKDAHSYDPHGFPMSKRFEVYEHGSGTGVKLNITARSMAVQAPYNWGREDTEVFFTRHFFRALLQRVLVDRGVVEKPTIPKDLYGAEPESGGDLGAVGNPIIVGSIGKRKSALTSFRAYFRAVVAKLSQNPQSSEEVIAALTAVTDEELDRYQAEYWHRKHHLNVTWSLMSLSCTLVEAIIVVDRWQFLREQDSVQDCWVEPVFEYRDSPRNLAVIGIKK